MPVDLDEIFHVQLQEVLLRKSRKGLLGVTESFAACIEGLIEAHGLESLPGLLDAVVDTLGSESFLDVAHLVRAGLL